MSSSQSRSAESALALIRAVQLPPLQLQPTPRPLSPYEFDEAKRQIARGWEQQSIFSLLETPGIQGFKYTLLQGSTLFLITPEPSKGQVIAQEVNAILTWLGANSRFTIYLWYRDDPRKLKANQWPTRLEVNGGWTKVGTPNIIIYRKEEWQRVLIHEMIHAMKWDWDLGPTPAPCWKMNKTDKINPHLFEAWTELYAEWLACVWYGTDWRKQREWQDFQATQILARATHKWEEDTSVFAYYVLKAALAPHFEFLWAFGQGKTPQEKQYVICGLVTPELERLRSLAKRTVPQDMSMRMSIP